MAEHNFSKVDTRVRFPSPAQAKLKRGSPQAACSHHNAYCLVLQSLKDNRTYVGYTNNFKRRLNKHNLGHSKSTKYRFPFKVFFTEEFENIKTAKKCELW